MVVQSRAHTQWHAMRQHLHLIYQQMSFVWAMNLQVGKMLLVQRLNRLRKANVHLPLYLMHNGPHVQTQQMVRVAVQQEHTQMQEHV